MRPAWVFIASVTTAACSEPPPELTFERYSYQAESPSSLNWGVSVTGDQVAVAGISGIGDGTLTAEGLAALEAATNALASGWDAPYRLPHEDMYEAYYFANDIIVYHTLDAPPDELTQLREFADDMYFAVTRCSYHDWVVANPRPGCPATAP